MAGTLLLQQAALVLPWAKAARRTGVGGRLYRALGAVAMAMAILFNKTS